VTNSGILGASW